MTKDKLIAFLEELHQEVVTYDGDYWRGVAAGTAIAIERAHTLSSRSLISQNWDRP